jgi:signal transduction histidine kinase
MQDTRSALSRFGVALALVAVALQLALLLRPYLSAAPDAVFVAAVALASWYGGLLPGLLATVGSALTVDYFLIPPLREINFDTDHLIRLATFSVVSLLISWISHTLQRETKRAAQGETDARRELTERQRVEGERVALLVREREARRQAEAAQRRLAFLAEAGRLVASSLEFEPTLASIGRLVVPAISDWCFVYLLQPDGAVRRATVACQPVDEPLARDIRSHRPSPRLRETPTARRVLRGERMLFAEVDDDVLRAMAEDDEHGVLLRRLDPSSIMIVPLQVHRRVFGAVLFASTTAERRFSSEDLDVAGELAGRAAAALANAQLYEEAQDANRMKDEFLATVSHELRTPLHAILGWSRLLSSGSLGDEASARALETIERNAQAQAQLVGDILDVSRIVTGKLKLDMRPLPVAIVIESALDAVRPAAHAKAIQLEASLADSTLAVLGDPGRLQQIAWNLLSNAIKFTPSGGRVEVHVQRAGSDVAITVSDTGIGIDRSFLPYVFDRFRQADSSASRSHGGLGLGLAIVRHLAELHGGRVSVESEGRGGGATFTVCLPALAAGRPGGAGRPPGAGQHVPGSVLLGLRVLAVDDQADARNLIAASLERYGATVTTAASAREALEIIDAERPHVLIGDIGMPDEDGYALIRTLRARPGQQGGQIPAIALTAYARREDHDRAIDAGFQLHLAKPIDQAELVEAVASLAGRGTA